MNTERSKEKEFQKAYNEAFQIVLNSFPGIREKLKYFVKNLKPKERRIDNSETYQQLLIFQLQAKIPTETGLDII